MTHQELNRLYEERMNHLAPYVRAMSGGNKDLGQQCAIGICQALSKDPHGNDRFLKNSAKWEMLNYLHRGRSVDNGFYKRENVISLHDNPLYDNGVLDMFIFKNKTSMPLDEMIIDKIHTERFFSMLTQLEKSFVNYRLEGWSNSWIMEKLRISYSKLRNIKRKIRFKIELAFTA
jgi:hypothetical protein